MEKLFITGNLTRDPEARVTPSGINVCTFTVAVNKPLTKAQREAGEQAQAKFFRVTAWRELGDNCVKYLTKGKKVLVVGTIDANAYIGQQDGQAHASLEVTASEVEFLTPRGEQEAVPAATTAAPAPGYSPAPQAPAGYAQAPAGYAPAPAGYTAPAPQGYAAPQGYTPQQPAPASPPGFTPVETDELPF